MYLLAEIIRLETKTQNQGNVSNFGFVMYEVPVNTPNLIDFNANQDVFSDPTDQQGLV